MLSEHVVESLASTVVDTLEDRGQGHCLQIAHIPSDVADEACEIVANRLRDPDRAVMVTSEPAHAKPWQTTPSRVVELRNLAEETGGKLALFIPAGQHVAAEDSFGRSTFEVLDLDGLHRDVFERLRLRLRSLDPSLAERADEIVAAARHDRKFAVGDREMASYLARVVHRPSKSELGDALIELGLLPDPAIAEEETSGLPVRLARNLHHIEALTELGPPADRIQAMAISPELGNASDLKDALVEALHDGTVDRHELASRLGGKGDGPPPLDFGPVIAAMGGGAFLHELSILSLAGDLKADMDPPTIRRSNASVRVRYRCRPAPDSVDGLRQLRLELLQIAEQGGELVETGVETTKAQGALSRNSEASWTLKVPTQNLDSGLYRLRLRAVDIDNNPFKEALSETFRIHEEIEDVEEQDRPAVSLAAVRVEACVGGVAETKARTPRITAVSGTEQAGQTRSFAIRFEGSPMRWRLDVSRLLAQVEMYSFAAPRSLARYRVSLVSSELEETILPDETVSLPDSFLDARERVLSEIQRHQYPVEGETDPLVELADFSALGEWVAQYLEAWTTALEGASSESALRALLSVDQVSFSDGPLADGVLIGPMHPLRLAWLAHYQFTLDEWLGSSAAREAEADEVIQLLEVLAPADIPHVVVTDQGELRHLEPLDLHWGIWAPPSAPDVGALAGIVRSRLQLPRTAVGGIGVGDVVQRIRRYLAAHPYVELLEMNFVQPGAAQLVLQALLALQSDRSTEHLRYVIRLFATELSRSELGRALDDFMAEPEATKSGRRNESDAFLSSTDDPLAPKLTYSKHPAVDLLVAPERFPAHLTFFLDWFDLDVVPVPPAEERRSFYAGGLIVDPVVVYREGSESLNPQWDEHVAPASVLSTHHALTGAYAAAERATARLLGAGAAGTVPAVRLELDRVRRSILDAVHRHSDWVVVIDPVFTDDYLDSPPEPGEPSRYLIDYTDPGALATARRIMISTRSRTELGNLLRPVLDKYGLEVPDDRVEVLLDAFRALGAGLPLKLLNNPTMAVEALSLSLAAVYLASRGVLRHALVIPLDVHQELWREMPATDTGDLDLRRTDLAVIRIDPDDRRIAVSLVEVKARGALPVETPSDLVEHIDAQLENSRSVLRRRLFSAEVRARQGSLAGALMVRRLTRILSRYAERAVRYRFLNTATVAAMRPFLATLDESFKVSFEKHALLFDLEGDSQPATHIGDVRVQRIGRDEILDLLARTQTPVGTQLPGGEVENLETVFSVDREAAMVEEIPESVDPGDARSPERDELTPEQVGDAPPEVKELEGPRREDVLLLGSTRDCDQYGIVGRLNSSGRNVAFDVDGTNVVAIFGVQGSGKSYTVGNLIEAALMPVPQLNRLAHPLAAAVFHYSRNDTYLPEFAAMVDANDDPAAIEMLASEYGVDPRGIDDVRILVPEPLLAERREEFPGLDVHPLLLSTAEMSINDWKLLMGVEGGDQLYVKAMTTVFRSLRNHISLPALRAQLDGSSLTQQQKSIAKTRIEFVEEFASDHGGAAEHMRPGRLLIVDVRDPLMDENDALGLFMVLLRLFAQAQTDDGKNFSKLIVFDEAHKYMDNTRLTGAIVETVREMRHLGTTVVIASQNPPSVPRDVIELCSVLVAHSFTSPQWLEHIRKVNEAFARDLSPPQLAGLPSGEAFVWTRDGADELRRPQRVRMRPRLTRHGGGTRRAGDDR